MFVVVVVVVVVVVCVLLCVKEKRKSCVLGSEEDMILIPYSCLLSLVQQYKKGKFQNPPHGCIFCRIEYTLFSVYLLLFVLLLLPCCCCSFKNKKKKKKEFKEKR